MRVRARLDLSVLLCGVTPPSSPASVLTLLSPEAHVAWRGDGDTLGMSTGPCTEARAGSAPIRATVLSEPRKRDPRCTAFLFPGEGSARGRPAGGTRTRAACPAADGATSPPAPAPCDGWTARGAESRADRRSTLYFRTVIARAPKPRRRVPRKDSLSGVRGRTVSVVGRGFCGQGPNGRRLAGPVR